MVDWPADGGSDRLLLVIPTYDERDNLGRTIARVHRAMPGAHVLVVDDASPDGTGELADELAAADPRIQVMHRAGKEGLGAAYLAGFAAALSGDFAAIGQMDADGSHPPEALPGMLATLAEAQVVIGSRYVPGGGVRNWPKHRELLSRGGNLYSRLALGVGVRDVTAGYRLYRPHVLETLDLAEVRSQGYCFQIDMAWRAIRAGFSVREVPITFVEREHGESKMSQAIVAEALWQVTRWGLRGRIGQGDARGKTVSA